jgi:hypothetical protein
MNRFAVAAIYKFDLSPSTNTFKDINNSLEDILVSLVKETT